MGDTTSITLDKEVKEKLEEFKQDGTWNEFFRRLIRELSEEELTGAQDVQKVELTDTERERIQDAVGQEFQTIIRNLQ